MRTTIRLPEVLAEKLEEVRKARLEPTMSSVIRRLLVQQLASLSYLNSKTKKALGFSDYENEKK